MRLVDLDDPKTRVWLERWMEYADNLNAPTEATDKALANPPPLVDLAAFAGAVRDDCATSHIHYVNGEEGAVPDDCQECELQGFISDLDPAALAARALANLGGDE